MAIVTRFAPSPTGDLHLGHILAAKIARDLSKTSHEGAFLLRHEDIDSGRVKPEFYSQIEEDLTYLGLTWEGEPLWQSKRTQAYADALKKLQDLELVYPCFCTRKEIQTELAQMFGAPHQESQLPYPGICRKIDASESLDRMKRGESHCWRFQSAKAASIHGELHFSDLRFGKIKVDPSLNGDVVLARKDLGPAYHLAVIVDDAFQNITHVTRGEDLLTATHVHRQLQALFGLEEPIYFHHQLVRDDFGIRLAKRNAAYSIRNFRKQGLKSEDLMKMLKV